MNTSAPPSTRPARAWSGFGSLVCGLVLTAGHLATGYLVVVAYLADPVGPWDHETVAHSDFAAGFGLALSALTALLTWVFVKAEWLRRWWYGVPALLAAVALLRLTLLAPEL
ncbi:hypothetical protein [Streptomyces sp. CAI-85]|uniref:hypothetical protein n=1 Tax=Streptomyces sp. CAI-85 TaxID=1472662 RepID=UPI001587443B|nr:hypothetical protein [Streptomyces sp. CAI-85]NUV63152.1 hypothetical protein [Streptomyces sp. CAI-85]